MKWRIIPLAMFSVGCERQNGGSATSKPAAAGPGGAAASIANVTIKREYEPIADYTHVDTSSIVRQVGGRRVSISAGFMCKGRKPSRFIESLALQVSVKTGGPSDRGGTVPFKLTADGGPLAGATNANACTLAGLRAYSIFMSEDALGRLVKAESVTVAVEDLTLDLSAYERNALAKLVESVEEWRKPAIEGVADEKGAPPRR